MTTTATNGSGAPGSPMGSAPSSSRPMPVAPGLPAPRGRRRPGLLALGVALIAVGALVAVWLVNSTSHRDAVVVMMRDVPYGATITSADLGTAEVSVDSTVNILPASDVNSVVGTVAATNLTQGSLLNRAQLATSGPPATGQVLVPVAVAGARMPAGGLQPGDQVLVVTTPAADADPAATPPQTIAATIVRLGSPDVNAVTVVDVTVAIGDGPALAARSATGRIALVVEPRTG